MSIYDSLLANQQQGLQTQNANQMQIAQMPNFADKFLAGLKSGQQTGYQQQMGLSNLEMNQVYKAAQEQQMKDLADSRKFQRANELMKESEYGLTPESRALYAARGVPLGIPESAWPTQQFTTTPGGPTDIATEPSSPGNASIYGTGAVNDVGQGPDVKTPVPGTGYGSRFEYQQNKLDNQWDIANLKGNSQLLMLQYKQMEPKSALGKLNADYARLKGTPSEISDQDYSAMRSKLETLVNPLAAPWLGQGYVAPATLNRPGTALPGQGNPQATPGIPTPSPDNPKANLGGGTKPSNTPVLPSQPTSYTPGPMTPKTAVTAAQDEGKIAGATTTLDALISNIDKAISMPGINSGTFIPGLGTRGRDATPEGKAFNAQLGTVGAAEIVNQINAMKTNGVGTSRLSQGFLNQLANMVGSIDTTLDGKTLAQNLLSIRQVASQLKNNLLSQGSAVSAARGMSPSDHQAGEIQPDSQGNKWRWSGIGDYNDQRTWTQVQ